MAEEQHMQLTDEQLGAYLSDMTEITEDWLRDFWGFIKITQKGKTVLRLPYELTNGGRYGGPEWTLPERELLLDSRLYFREKTAGRLVNYRSVEMTRGRFFGYMWSVGYMPVGFSADVENLEEGQEEVLQLSDEDILDAEWAEITLK